MMMIYAQRLKLTASWVQVNRSFPEYELIVWETRNQFISYCIRVNVKNSRDLIIL